ncbi:Aminopeptidase 2 [Fusarium oxysporum f. sp. albedinis]|nr:Aminopeptidase 2 [Fusarium oxysporum f. sp. albedinis]
MWVLQTVRRMTGVIEPDAWIKATTQLTQANDILRTTWLEASPGNWVGVVLRDAQLNITTVALDSEDEISNFLEDFWRTRFEFGRPFIKYAIITHGDSSWDLVIKMDHAASLCLLASSSVILLSMSLSKTTQGRLSTGRTSSPKQGSPLRFFVVGISVG